MSIMISTMISTMINIMFITKFDNNYTCQKMYIMTPIIANKFQNTRCTK